jgi:predicted house-cleaning noncanonical NTP pyrophosphatase (MazG superfamily)
MTSAMLIEFLNEEMSMTEIYQPAVIKELVENGGFCTKDTLAAKLAEHDIAVRQYYRQVVMRWPKKTLEKHGVVSYDRNTTQFTLECGLSEKEAKEVIRVCDEKINEWLEKKKDREKSPRANESVRYSVIRDAKGKCGLCGIPSSLRPLDVDHIVPQSKAKQGKVEKNGRLIPVNSEENLQALCFRCNRAKRAGDDKDFRRRNKLVRDNIPDIIREDGRNPIVRQVRGRRLVEALREKLVEEHEEYIQSSGVEELADLIEVAVSLAKLKGVSEEQLLKLVSEKRQEKGSFQEGYFYEGDREE